MTEVYTKCTNCEIRCWSVRGAKCACGGMRVMMPKMTRNAWRRLARRIHHVHQTEGIIRAIKSLRRETDCGLLDAKNAVERLAKVNWKHVKIVPILLAALTLSACDEETSREVYKSYTETRDISCTYSGFCYDCGIDWDGDYSCGFRYTSCDGHQSATVRVTPFETFHKSGKVRQHEDILILTRTGPCR